MEEYEEKERVNLWAKRRKGKEERERRGHEGSKRTELGRRMSDVALLFNLEFFLFSVSAWVVRRGQAAGSPQVMPTPSRVIIITRLTNAFIFSLNVEFKHCTIVLFTRLYFSYLPTLAITNGLQFGKVYLKPLILFPIRS